jgi:hypothetical protein
MKWSFKTPRPTFISSPEVELTPGETSAQETAEPAPSTPSASLRRNRRRLLRSVKRTGLGIGAAGGLAVLFQREGQTAFASSGSFTSNVQSVPAMVAIGTNGASGIVAGSDTGYGLLVATSSTNSAAISATANGANGAAVTGSSTNGVGLSGTAGGNNGTGVLGSVSTASGYGVNGVNNSGVGVYGVSNGDRGPGVSGLCSGRDGIGVLGTVGGTYGTGVSGTSTGDAGIGVSGICSGNDGVAVYAHGTGVFTAGVSAISDNSLGLYASGNPAASFSGNVAITGSLSKGGGSFLIDHPLDPANKSLYHSFVESPDMKNIYDGVAVLDQQGQAVVTLPDWFGALNSDFRYQLTCLGGHAPVYIASEVENNQFSIAGGSAGLKVSWLVTGIRQDLWAQANRIPVEQEKSAELQGRYHHPTLYGQSETMSIVYPSRLSQL